MSVCYFDAYILPTIQFDSRQGRYFPSRQQALYCSPTERSGFGLRLRDTEYMHRAITSGDMPFCSSRSIVATDFESAA